MEGVKGSKSNFMDENDSLWEKNFVDCKNIN